MNFVVPQWVFELMYKPSLNSIWAVIAELPDKVLQARSGNSRCSWRSVTGVGGKGDIAFAILDLDKSTGRQLVLAALAGATAPRHFHTGGETILTLLGQGVDHDSSGELVVLRPGNIMVHPSGSAHAPTAAGFWLILYYQPTGSI